jgi:hypothetical protein
MLQLVLRDRRVVEYGTNEAKKKKKEGVRILDKAPQHLS